MQDDLKRKTDLNDDGLPPTAPQLLRWREARAERDSCGWGLAGRKMPIAERDYLERTRRLAFAAVLQDPDVLEMPPAKPEALAEVLALAQDAGDYLTDAETGRLHFTNTPLRDHLQTVRRTFRRWHYDLPEEEPADIDARGAAPTVAGWRKLAGTDRERLAFAVIAHDPGKLLDLPRKEAEALAADAERFASGLVSAKDAKGHVDVPKSLSHGYWIDTGFIAEQIKGWRGQEMAMPETDYRAALARGQYPAASAGLRL